MADVFMPQLGETVADGTVTKWFKQVGDTVTRGEPLFEVATDKVDTEIPAQADGVLTEVLVPEGTTVDVGTRLAVIGGDTASPSAPTVAGPAEVLTTAAAAASSAPRLASRASEKLSPLVRRLLAENGLSAQDVTGTGPDGRITRRDVEAAAGAASTPVVSAREGDEVIPFSKIRKLTAEHMVRSKATSAHTLMVKEVDFEAVERVRRSRGAQFKDEEGFSLTYLPFVAVAALAVLREFPHLNASVGHDELIVHHTLNLGIAVDLDAEGLVVPVIKRADQYDVREIARHVREIASRARTKALGVDDMSGGTFTITNPGPYGTLMTGAVINQPQVAILSTDGVARKPVVVTGADGTEAIAIHSVGLVALTFDHRAVDGAYAARFLARLATLLQDTDWGARL